jgi:hypothetical protein
VDTPRTLQILDAFLAEYPEYAPARPKLLASLLANATERRQVGDDEAAEALLTRARALRAEPGPTRSKLIASSER